tara:strand:- start:12119 stop:12448 length:330 start_codon:yes stop_codon:yes gene_type:complete
MLIIFMWPKDYKKAWLNHTLSKRHLYLVIILYDGMTRIVCVKCEGVGWAFETELKLKCDLCDLDGFADLQDSIDYFTFIDNDLEKLDLLWEKERVSKTVSQAFAVKDSK